MISSLWKRLVRKVQTGRQRFGWKAVLQLERLEDRVVPAWSALGPAPQLNAVADFQGAFSEAVTGRITALAIGQDAAGQTAIFAGAAAGGIWRSTDFTGNFPTWSPRTDFVGAPGPVPIDSATGLGAGAITVGVWSRGIYRSDDDGQTWRPVVNGLPEQNIGRLGADHTVGQPSIFAAVVNDGGNNGGRIENVYRSTNDGANWTALNSPTSIDTEGGKHFSFARDPSNGRLYIGGVADRNTNGVAEYTPADGAWRWITWGTNDIVPHSDLNAWAFYDGKVYNGNDGGFWRYNPEANPGPPDVNTRFGTWDDLNSPPGNPPDRARALNTMQVNRVAVHPGDANILLAASHDNSIARTRNGGTRWDTPLPGGDGMGAWFDPVNQNTAYLMYQDGSLHRIDDITADAPQSVDIRKTDPEGFPTFAPFTTLDLGGNSRLLLGAKHTVYESVNQGTDWTSLGQPTNQGLMSVLAYAPQNVGGRRALGNVIYAGFESGRLYRTDDHGNNWAAVANPCNFAAIPCMPPRLAGAFGKHRRQRRLRPWACRRSKCRASRCCPNPAPWRRWDSHGWSKISLRLSARR